MRENSISMPNDRGSFGCCVFGWDEVSRGRSLGSRMKRLMVSFWLLKVSV